MARTREPPACPRSGVAVAAVSVADIRVQYGAVDDLDWLDRELGKRIRVARGRTTPSLTQDALAQRAGLARTSITNIETGNQQPTLHALWRIADALGVSPCDLLPPWPRPGKRSNSRGLPTDVPQGTRAFLERLENTAATPTRRRA